MATLAHVLGCPSLCFMRQGSLHVPQLADSARLADQQARALRVSASAELRWQAHTTTPGCFL